MFSRLRFSFPPKVALLIFLAVILPAVFIFTQYVARGTVTFVINEPDAYVYIDGDQYSTPYTATYRTGRKQVRFGAAGYNEELTTVTIPAFRRKKTVTLQPTQKILFETDEVENALDEFLNEQPWHNLLPYEESGQFIIEFPTPGGTYPITLLPKPRNYDKGEDDPHYAADLKEAKQKAYEWLKKQNVDPEKLDFQWFPYDPGAH